MNSILNFLILSLFFLIFSRPADAYLDPGSGSFIIQMLIAAVLGGLVTVKVYFDKIKRFFKKSKKNNKDSQDEKR